MSRMATVLQLLSRGRSMTEIGAELGMREEAVDAMIDHLLRQGYLSSIQCKGCGFCTKGCSCSEQKVYALTPKGEDLRNGVQS